MPDISYRTSAIVMTSDGAASVVREVLAPWGPPPAESALVATREADTPG